MNVFFRMSEEQIYPPSGSFLFQHKVIGSLESAIGFNFDKKYKNNITGNLGTYDRTMRLKIPNVRESAHGTVPLVQLNGEFFARNSPNPITDDLSGFVFAVIDHNSAHHLSYVLARRAFTGNTASKKIIVSFDRHQDYGSANLNIACDTWGYFTRNGNTKFADNYIVIGTKKPTGGNAGKYSCTVDSGTGRGEAWLSDANALINKLGITDKTTSSNVVLYVTIDRDWTNVSYTPYGDGYYDYRSGYDNFLIPFLTKVKSLIISIDIIGLPSVKGHSTEGSGTSKQTNDYGVVAANHIKSVYEVF